MREKDGSFERVDFIKSVFVSALDKENKRLVASKEYAISELVSGVLDYLGKENSAVYRNFLNDSIFHRHLDNLIEISIKNSRHLDNKVSETLIYLIESSTEHTPPERAYPTTNFYNYWNISPYNFLGFPISGNSSTFEVPESIIESVKTKFLPSLNDKQKENIIGIGNSMKLHIKSDLEYLSSRAIY